MGRLFLSIKLLFYNLVEVSKTKLSTMPVSSISNTEIKESEIINGYEIRAGIFNMIKKDFPDFMPESIISIEELNKYRRLYLAHLIEQEKGELQALDYNVMQAIKDNSILSKNFEPVIVSQLTTEQKLADKIAEFGGIENIN